MLPLNSKIILADDSRAIRTLVRQQLGHLGYNDILDFENGRDVLAALEQLTRKGEKVDFFIVDWRMPEMDGLELLRALLQDEKYKKTPYLMIAAEREIEFVLKAVELGVSDYIVKPFDENILSNKIQSVWTKWLEENGKG